MLARGMAGAIVVAALMAACGAPPAPEPKSNPALDAAASEGTRYTMVSLIGIGDIVLAPEAMITSDGQRIPIRVVSPGVWAFPNPPSKLTNGENFCFSKPVTFFTLHEHEDGVLAINVGDWSRPPSVPAADQWSVDGGCGLSTYKLTEG